MTVFTTTVSSLIHEIHIYVYDPLEQLFTRYVLLLTSILWYFRGSFGQNKNQHLNILQKCVQSFLQQKCYFWYNNTFSLILTEFCTSSTFNVQIRSRQTLSFCPLWCPGGVGALGSAREGTGNAVFAPRNKISHQQTFWSFQSSCLVYIYTLLWPSRTLRTVQEKAHG